MTEYSKEVREEAARRANAWSLVGAWTADSVVSAPAGRALCQAVQDGALHLDPVELDKARWDAATTFASDRYGSSGPVWQGAAIGEYRRLVREGWTPPEVDPVEQVAREMFTEGGMHHACASLNAALAKLRLKIVPEDGQ